MKTTMMNFKAPVDLADKFKFIMKAYNEKHPEDKKVYGHVFIKAMINTISELRKKLK